MIVIHRGAGMLAPGFGILSALLINILTSKMFADGYYQEHHWPKLTVLLLAGTGCLVSGMWLKQQRARDAQKEQEHIESLSPKSGAVKTFAYSGPRDHLMFIPLQYWSIVYFGAALFYLITSR
jgi:hypothetical protein